jgi:uncharacterized protein YdaU (DUF1376 family)
MTPSPAFQFYPNDWLSSPRITLMTPEQEGAYIRLLAYDWANDGIPDDDAHLATLSRMGEGWFKGGSRVVRECFGKHPSKEGHLTNARLEKEREKQREWRQKSSDGGKKSAASRACKGRRVVEPPLKGGCTLVDKWLEPNGNSSSSSSIGTNTQTRAQDAGPDYPKNLDEVLTEADMRGIPKTQAEDFFNHFESSGWIDKNGHPVKNWRAKLRTWKTIAVSAAAEKAHHGAGRAEGPSPLELRPLNALRAFNARLEREEREGR